MVSESSDGEDHSPAQVLRDALKEAGATEALHEALRFADRDEPPQTREEMFRFLHGPLEKALVGILHPATVAHVLATVRERLSGVDRSGTRMRSSDEVVLTESMAETVPPPTHEGAEHAYDDLITGAVHSRVTPAWGLQVVDADSHETTIWAIVSNDTALSAMAKQAAPRSVDVIDATSMAILTGALGRAESSASAVVLDAEDPSIKLDRVFAVLTDNTADVRVILWRMDNTDRERLIEAIPIAQSWLPCEAEVTPAEIMQLLGA